MIKVCRDRSEIKEYKELFFLTNISNSIPQLLLNRSLFLEARKLFAAGNILIEVWKIEEGNQKKIFYLKKHRDMIKTPEGINIEVDVNFNGCDMFSEENIDVKLLEKAECFVFEELEEYTYELTEFIRKKFPKAHIFFLDPYAIYFWNGDDRIRVLESLYDLSVYWDSKYMFITSNEKNHEYLLPESSTLIYNSYNIMNSLCWAKKVENLGSKNSENIILLIDIGFGVECGLAFIIRTVCTFAYMAKSRGWIPVVNLTGENMYIDKETANMWEQYFEPLSYIPVTEALESRKVISLKNNHLNASIIYINPYFREIWQKINIHPKIKFKKKLIQYFEESKPQDFQCENSKILGVFIRGTDARRLTETEISEMISDCSGIMEDNDFNKIFIATEDNTIFSAFKDRFKNKLMYIEQKRVKNLGGDRKLIGELLNIEKGEREKFGQTYLLITYCLSCCDALVYNIASGGFYLANKWRKKRYDFMFQINGRSTEIKTLIKFLKLVKKSPLAVIYGAGSIGKRIVELFKYGENNNIIFCDRKAESAEYYYEGYKVISPSLLLNEYKNDKIYGIIIASMNYTKDIYQFLITNGVKKEYIFIFDNQYGMI